MKEHTFFSLCLDVLIPFIFTIGGILAIGGTIFVLSQCTAVYNQSPDGSVHFSGAVAEPQTVTPQKE